jgi:hypothetical protein
VQLPLMGQQPRGAVAMTASEKMRGRLMQCRAMIWPASKWKPLPSLLHRLP